MSRTEIRNLTLGLIGAIRRENSAGRLCSGDKSAIWLQVPDFFYRLTEEAKASRLEAYRKPHTFFDVRLTGLVMESRAEPVMKSRAEPVIGVESVPVA